MTRGSFFRAIFIAVLVVAAGMAVLYVWSQLLSEDKVILRIAEDYAAEKIKLPKAKNRLAERLNMTENIEIANRVSELATNLRGEDKVKEAGKVETLAVDLRGVPKPPTTPVTVTPVPPDTPDTSICARLDRAWIAKEWDEVINILEGNRGKQLPCVPGSWGSEYLNIEDKLFAAHYNNCYEASVQGSRSKAIEQCEKALALKPGNLNANELLNRVRTQTVDRSTSVQAAGIVGTSAEVCTQLDNAWAAEEWDEVIKILERNRGTQLWCPPGSWKPDDLFIEEKLSVARSKNAGPAKVVSMSSENVCPELQNAWNNANWQQAIQILNEVRAGSRTCGNVDANDRLFTAHANYGLMLLGNQQWAQAAQECNTALSFRSQDPLAMSCVTQAATRSSASTYTSYPTRVPVAASTSGVTCADFEQAWNNSDWARVVEIGAEMKDNVLQCDHITDWRNKLYQARVKYGLMLSDKGEWDAALEQCQFALFEKPNGTEAQECIDMIKLALTPAQ